MNKFITSLFIFCCSQSISQNTRLWGTYYGGTEIGINESGNGTDTDPFGNVYVAGTISSNSGIATFGAFQTIYGGGNRDAFLVKFDANGNRLWGTYYGVTGLETGLDVGTDAIGNVYLLLNANTASPGLATAGAYQTAPAGGLDAVLVKFDANGNRVWATYFGGSGAESPSRLAIDGTGNVYIVGMTNGNNGVASGGFQNTIGGGQDLFLAKFDPTGALLWSTYYGGSVNENGVPSVAVDCNNNVYITATTTSSTNIAFNGFQNSLSGSTDAFLVKFDATGNRIWSTYYGGPGSPGIFGVSDIERTLGISTDITGNVYIVGQTTSTTNIAFNGHDTIYTPANPIINAGISYLAKFNSSGNRLWGTYYGEEDATGWSVATDICGNIYMSGTTTEQTPPSDISTPIGFQQTNGGSSDAFLTMFDSTGIRQWGTYYGGSGVEGVGVGEIALDVNSNLYIVGTTRSANAIATPGAFKTTITGITDIYLAKFTTGGCAKYSPTNCTAPLVITTTFINDSCNSQCAGSANTTPSGGVPPYSYLWSNGDTTQTADSLCAGSYTVTVTDGISNTIIDTVVISEPPLITFSQSFTECQGFSITVGGNTYTTSGTFTDTIFGGSLTGCDSIVTTNLTINPISSGVDVITSCIPITWLDGNTYSASTNIPTNTIVVGAANGCDSIVSLNLTINSSATGVDVITSCTPITWIDGNTYSVSTNTPKDTLVAANGCDSVITLNLTINSAITSTDVIVSCTPIVWIDGNTYSASTTTPKDTLLAANGCDSVVTLNLTINSATTSTDVINSCTPITWIDGNNYSVSTNTPKDTLLAANGCDSIVTLNLTINNAVTSTDIQTACSSFTWIDGITYIASTNTPTFTIVGGAVNGCDSLVTLYLTISSIATGTDVQAACNNYTWIDGNNYTASTNTPTFTIAGGSSQGCDSIVMLNLTVNSTLTSTLNPIICSGNTFTLPGGVVVNTAGTYNDTLISFGGCDSVVTTDLTIVPSSNTEVSVPNVFTPNNDGQNDLFKIEHIGSTIISTKIFNRWGSLLYESTFNGGWDGRTTSGTEAVEGTYFYIIEAEIESCNEKENKKFKGALLLLR